MPDQLEQERSAPVGPRGPIDVDAPMFSPHTRLAGRVMLLISYVLPLICFGLSAIDDKIMVVFPVSAAISIPIVICGSLALSFAGRGMRFVLMAILHALLVLGLHLGFLLLSFILFGHGGF